MDAGGDEGRKAREGKKHDFPGEVTFLGLTPVPYITERKGGENRSKEKKIRVSWLAV